MSNKLTFNRTLNHSINGAVNCIFRSMKQMYADQTREEEKRQLILDPFRSNPIHFDFKLKMSKDNPAGYVSFNFIGSVYPPAYLTFKYKQDEVFTIPLGEHHPSVFRFNTQYHGNDDAIRLFHRKTSTSKADSISVYDVQLFENDKENKDYIFNRVNCTLTDVVFNSDEKEKLRKEMKGINTLFGSNISLHDDYTRLYICFPIKHGEDIYLSLTDYIKLLLIGKYMSFQVNHIFKSDTELMKNDLPLPEIRLFYHHDDKPANHKREVASYIKSRFMKLGKRPEVTIDTGVSDDILDEKVEVLHNEFADGLYTARANRQRFKGVELTIDSNILNDSVFVYDANKDKVTFDAHESDVIGQFVETNHNLPEFLSLTFNPVELVALFIKDYKGEDHVVDLPRLIIAKKSRDGSYISNGFNSYSHFSDKYYYHQPQSISVERIHVEEVGFNQLHSLYLKQVHGDGNIVYMHLAEWIKKGIKAHGHMSQKYKFFATYLDKEEKKEAEECPLKKELQIEFKGVNHCNPGALRPFAEAILKTIDKKNRETEELLKHVESFRTHLARYSGDEVDDQDILITTLSINGMFRSLLALENTTCFDNELTLKVRKPIFNHDVYPEIISTSQNNGRHYAFKVDAYKGRFSDPEGWDTGVLLPFLINGNVVKFTASAIGYSYINANHQFISLYENSEELIGHSFMFDSSGVSGVNHIQTIGFKLERDPHLLLTNDPYVSAGIVKDWNDWGEKKLYVKGDISDADWTEGEIKEKKALIRLDVYLLLLKLTMSIE